MTISDHIERAVSQRQKQGPKNTENLGGRNDQDHNKDSCPFCGTAINRDLPFHLRNRCSRNGDNE